MLTLSPNPGSSCGSSTKLTDLDVGGFVTDVDSGGHTVSSNLLEKSSAMVNVRRAPWPSLHVLEAEKPWEPKARVSSAGE